MSRVGRSPIVIPAGVDVAIEGNTVAVKGPLGELKRDVSPEMTLELKDGSLLVRRPSDEPRMRSLHGLTRTLVANMVEGVAKGFERRLELIGVGYRAVKKGEGITLTIGYSHPVEITPPKGVEIQVPVPTAIVVRGSDREAVGEIAAKIRAVRPPEPYQGKGIRYQGEIVRKKVGKTGKK